MKKAHIHNFILIIFAYLIPFLVNLYFEFQNEEVSSTIKYAGFLSILIIILLPIIFYLVNNIYNLFIKHHKKVNLTKPRLLTFFVTLASTFVFIYLNLEYYFYFGSMILVTIFYFIFLYYLDSRYIKKSKENKININNELVNEFLNLLGGKENVINVSYEASRLKVEVKNIKNVDLEKIKTLGAQGLFIAGNKLQAIVGNNASELEKAIKRYLTNI